MDIGDIIVSRRQVVLEGLVSSPQADRLIKPVHRILQFIPPDELLGLRNAVRAALIVTLAAWENHESRGCHYRE